MRKHFLILMLLSLLPLAGWAAIDISNYRITVVTDNYVFTGEPVAIVPQVKNENLTNPTPLNYNVDGVDDDYQLVFYKDGVELLGAPSAVGSYVVKARGIGNYSGETSTGAGFIIRKAELTIEIGTLGDATANPVVLPTFKKNYKAADPAMPAIADWIFKVEGAAISNNAGQGLLNVTTTPYYEYTGENAKAEGYDITFKGFSLKSEYEGNYELTVVARKMIIDPIAITVTGQNPTVAVTPATVPAHEYDGTAYKPTFTLKYTYGTGASDVYTLNSDNANDYVLAYYPYANNQLGENAVANPINAGTYHAYITAGTSGNFTAVAGGVKVGEFTITQKALTIAVNPKTKDYDGEAFDEDDAEFTISGLASTDEGNIEGLAAAVHEGGDPLSANAGSWTMDVVYDEATIGTGNNAPLLSDNYIVTPLSSTWKINKLPLTVKAKDVTTVLGTPVNDVNSEVEVTGAINDTEKSKIAGLFKITKANGFSTDAFGVFADAFEIAEKTQNEYGDGYAAAAAYLNNYEELTAEGQNPTLLNGSLTVTGGNFIVMPVISNKIPYGTTPVPEVLAYTTGDNPTQLVENTDYEKVGNAYGFKVKLATDADEAANWKSIDQFNFTVNTTYNIKVDAATVKGKGNYVKAANAQEDNFTCASATFTIKPKKVYYQISDVTLHVGDTEDNLNEGTTKATATLKTGEGYEDNTLVGDETLEFTFKFAEGVAGLVIDPQTHKISTEEGFQEEGNEAITAEVKNGDYSGNYEVDFTEGDLLFAALELILDPEDEDMAAKISEAKTNGNKFEITFKSRTTGENATSTFAKSTMKANEWYAKVLPFDITTVELVKALNAYVVVNVLSEASTDKNYKFKIEMSNIPAGTPFLIKPEKDINWSVFNLDETRKITADAAKTVTVQQEGKDVVTFTGTFAPMTMHYNDTDADIAERVWWLSDTDYQATKIANDWRKPKNNAHKLGAMEAYLIAGEGWTSYSPTFTVEDFDFENNTTAIKVLNTQTMKAYDAEGWYNLNGVKLQGAPTEKGIYINNGKKVIVK